jgi:hypothetical protein
MWKAKRKIFCPCQELNPGSVYFNKILGEEWACLLSFIELKMFSVGNKGFLGATFQRQT